MTRAAIKESQPGFEPHSTLYSKLLIDDHPLQVLPALAVAVGLNEEIILQQLHYWTRRSTNSIGGHLWVYNTYEEWQAQFPLWSVSTIRRIFGNLEAQGVVVAAKHNTQNWDQRKWYRIDYNVLNQQGLTMGDKSP
jgi:hypothetical protein